MTAPDLQTAQTAERQQHTWLKRQIAQELSHGGKWHRMPELLNRMHEARVALQAGHPACRSAADHQPAG